jgi:hypothetical protein
MPGKRVQFDQETRNALDLLAKDSMRKFQELAVGEARPARRSQDSLAAERGRHREAAAGAIGPTGRRQKDPQGRVRAVMGIRTRGLDIKADAKRAAADKAARAEVEAVIQRWNEQLALGRDIRSVVANDRLRQRPGCRIN